MNSFSCFVNIFLLDIIPISSFSTIFISSSFNSTLSSSSISSFFSITFSSSDSLSISFIPSIKFFSFFSFLSFFLCFTLFVLFIFILSIENLKPPNSNAKYFVISSLTKNKLSKI